MALLLVTIASGNAQVSPPQNPWHLAQASPQPPPPGFVSSYEIMQTLRSAGFDPLAPPLREGTVYVARATDYRGILMRVVLDARTGAIRDANRIVPGPGNYDGPYAESYGSEPDGAGPYGSAPYDPEPDAPQSYGRVDMVPPQPIPTPMVPNLTRPGTGRSVPLPRPRPPQRASRQPAEAVKPTAVIDSKADTRTKPDAAANAPTAATVPPAPAPARPNEAPSTLTINN